MRRRRATTFEPRGAALGLVLIAALPDCSSRGARPSAVPEVPAGGVADVAPAPAEAAAPDPGANGAPDAPAAAAPGARPPPIEPVASREEYLRLLRPLRCERDVRCGVIGASQLAECLAGDGDDRLDVSEQLAARLGIPELTAQERLVFDPERAGACVAFWRSGLPCRGAIAETAPAGCDAFLGPIGPGVAAGGRCKRWDECIDGFCSARVTECDGLCVAFLPAGAACGTEQLCGRDDFCDEGTCRPRIGEGGECLGHWQACRDGLFCEGFIPESEDPEFWHPAVPGKCVPPKGLGEPCATDRSDDICRADLFCDWGAEPPACRARLARDAECRWLDACADDLACVGLKLGGTNPFGRRLGTVAGGRCLPILDAGSACDPEAFVTGCPGSMLCDRTTRVCRSTGHEGDPCTSSWCPPDLPPGEPCEREGCFGTLYCDPQSLTCRQQAALGDRCRPRRDGEDEPCFMSECDPRRRRCVRDCEAR